MREKENNIESRKRVIKTENGRTEIQRVEKKQWQKAEFKKRGKNTECRKQNREVGHILIY